MLGLEARDLVEHKSQPPNTLKKKEIHTLLNLHLFFKDRKKSLQFCLYKKEAKLDPWFLEQFFFLMIFVESHESHTSKPPMAGLGSFAAYKRNKRQQSCPYQKPYQKINSVELTGPKWWAKTTK